MKRRFTWLLAAAVVVAGLAGCSPPAPAAGPAAGGTATFQSPMPAGTAKTTWTVIPIAPAGPVITQEKTMVPDAPIATPFDPALQRMVEQARADLAARSGVASEQIELVEVQSVTWPDGGLGCPQPGMAYIQIQVDGALIRLKAGDRVYEYHAGGARPPFLCESGQ